MSDSPDWEYLYRMDERRIAALEAIEDGTHILVERDAELEAERDAAIHMVKVGADAYVKLKAENERMRSFPAIALGCSGLEKRAEQAEAELAAIRARRCETCGWEYCTTEDDSRSNVDEPFYCARWRKRA